MSESKYAFRTCDVFTRTRFGGNPLAVLPRAEGLSDAQMQQIAREFNFSESAFVFPGDAAHDRNLRIFTPGREVPFAGHPNVGTAFALASAGEFGPLPDTLTVRFKERAGTVPVTIYSERGAVVFCEVTAPQTLSLGPEVALDQVAAAVSLSPGDVVTQNHPPRVASVGLSFVFVELRDREALGRAGADVRVMESIMATGVRPSIYLYVREGGAIRSRMFAPLSRVPEDPATGSAACAVSGLLAHLDPQPDGDFAWRITQGVEMGRPSALRAGAEKRGGAVQATRVGGPCVAVSEGNIRV